jgi:hypothetical protein
LRKPTFTALAKVYEAALASPTPFTPEEDARVDQVVTDLASRHRLAESTVRFYAGLDPANPSILSLIQKTMRGVASALVRLFR